MELRKCPICNNGVSDFLKHLRFTHNITDPDELEQEIKKGTNRENKKNEFAAYVEESQLKKKKGEITDEEYRELITQWIVQHRS